MLSDLEVDIYGLMASCMKGQRGETERFTLSLSMSAHVSIPLVGQAGQCMTDVNFDPIAFGSHSVATPYTVSRRHKMGGESQRKSEWRTKLEGY